VNEAERQRTEAARSAMALGLSTPSREATRLFAGGSGLVAIFAGFFLVALVAGWVLVSRQRQILRDRAHAFVAGVVDFRRNQLEAWIFERRGDAIVAGKDRVLVRALGVARNEDAKPLEEEATRRLELIGAAYRYKGLVAFDRDGQSRVVVGFDAARVPPEWVAFARAAMSANAARLIGFRRIEALPNGLSFDVVTPVVREDGRGGQTVVGALVLRMDPSNIITGAFSVPSTIFASAEISLVVGGSAEVFFVRLQQRSSGAPWVSAQLPAWPLSPQAMFARGAPSLAGARNERGAVVIAVAASLTDVPATVLGQVEEDELVAAGARALWLTVSLLAALFMTVALLARYGWARRTREALRANEEKFRIIFETMQEGYALSAIEGEILLVNPAMARMLGYEKASDLLGKSMPNDVFADPDERAKLRARLAETGAVQGYKATFKRVDGSPVIVEGNVRLLRDGSGAPVGVEGIVRDMTAHYEIRGELIAAREAAETAALAKSQFLANMSHEIRTPLNAIVGLGHLMLRSELPPRQRTYVNQIQSSARMLLGTVEHVLDFSKIDAGKLELEAVPFELDDVVEDVVGILSVQAQAKGVSLVTSFGPDVPRALLGDPLRLGQVLTNLAGNALKFTHAGQVTLAVEREDQGVGGARLKFSVRDTGIGISAEQLARIFEPFTQGDGSTTRQFGGTGLGLSISRQIVDLMGGHLEATSTPGQGSVFSFAVRFPVRAVAAVADAVAGPPEILRGARVLVAEDNAINQEVARELLESVGVVVFMANNGQDAVDAVLSSNGAIEAVLMDLQMPRLDGLAATRAIRAHAAQARLPIIAMTAHALVAERDHCLAAGMNDYVSKPFEPAELFALLARWLAGRSLVPDVASAPADGPAARPA
jgi:PAS domain S-box-containing protein